jgi:hypothetical protein
MPTGRKVHLALLIVNRKEIYIFREPEGREGFSETPAAFAASNDS